MIVRNLFSLAALTLIATGSYAQTNRADAAARTAASLERSQAAQQTNLQSGGDSRMQAEYDLGTQQPVSVRAGGLGFYALGDSSINYTSNPTLSRNGSKGDFYFVGRGGAGIYPNITGGLYLDGHVSQEVFLYGRNSNLNFSRFNAGGGLDYVFEDLGRLTASVRYEYERYLDGDTYDEFYVNHALTMTLAKEFLLNDVMAIQTGGRIALSLAAEPVQARRNEYDFWVGWRWRVLEPLELQTYYILSLFNYPDSTRVDVTNNVGGSLSLYITRWAKIVGSANFGANNSTESLFDYTVVNIGGTFGLDFRF